MKIIGNGRMITRNSANPWYDDGAVAFDGGIIKKGHNSRNQKRIPGCGIY